ncbi:hypothetical protein HC761_02445 [bacterium]|nr:hypothetical protein [bacterium]
MYKSVLTSLFLLSACAQQPLAQVNVANKSAQAVESLKPVPVAAPATETDFARFKRWFGGEFNNNEQVWQQKEDAQKTATGKVENPFEHIHHVFAPITAPQLGADIYFVKQYLDNDPSKIYRQRLYRFSESKGVIRLEIFSFNNEAAHRDLHLKPALAKGIGMAALKTTNGCDVFWRFDRKANAFAGTMQKDACKITSGSTGKPIFINDTLRLSESEIWIADVATDATGKVVWGRSDGQAHRNRKSAVLQRLVLHQPRGRQSQRDADQIQRRHRRDDAQRRRPLARIV